MARHPKPDPPIRVTFHLPESIHTRLRIALANGALGHTPRYGDLSSLLTSLISEWLSRRSIHTLADEDL